MNRKLKHILLLPIMVFAVLVNAQDIVFEHITTGEGLSQSTVNAIVQDQRGFMWFGTR